MGQPWGSYKINYPGYYLYGLAFVLATSVFIFLEIFWWIPTPSYNSLILESALILLIGILNLSEGKKYFVNWILIGFACWLAIMAKPTAAIALSLLSSVYIAIAQRDSVTIRYLFIFFITLFGLLILSSWLIDGSMHIFMTRIRDHLEALALLYDGELFKFKPLGHFLPDALTQLFLVLLTTIVFLSTLASMHQKHSLNYLFFLVSFLSFLICIHYYVLPDIFSSRPQTNFIILSLPIGAILALTVTLRGKLFRKTTVKFLMLGIYLALFPYAIALGTHTDVLIFSLRVGFFWILAILPLTAILEKPLFSQYKIIINILILAQLLTASLLQSSMDFPYRQTQSLYSQTKKLDIVNTHGKVTGQIYVSDSVAHQIAELRQAASNQGFSYGDEILDFTGLSPTALYIIGARAIGTPWFTPWPTLEPDFALTSLSNISCAELTKA